MKTKDRNAKGLAGLPRIEYTPEESKQMQAIDIAAYRFGVVILRTPLRDEDRDAILRLIGKAREDAQISFAKARAERRVDSIQFGPARVQLPDGTWKEIRTKDK